MMVGSPRWLRIVVAATAIIFAAVAIYVFGFAFTARLHPDDTVIVLLADKALHARSPVVSDWYYGNGEIWVLAPHLIALLPVAIAGVGKASLWISLVLGFAFQLAVFAKSYLRLTTKRWVAVFAAMAALIAWSHSHIDFEYVELAYGFGTCLYLLAFTQFAIFADGTAARRRGLLLAALLIALFAMDNPTRAMIFNVVPLLVACTWPWRQTSGRVRGAIAGAALVAWVLAFALYKLVLVRIVTFSYPTGYVSFAFADAKRIAANLHLLGDGLVALCGGDGSVVRALPGMLVVAGALALVFREVFSSRALTARRFVGAIILVQLAILSAPLVFGTVMSNETSVRYVIPSLISIVGLAVLIAIEALGERRIWPRRLAIGWLIALPLAALAAVPDARPPDPDPKLRPDALALEPVADALEQRGLRRGFAVNLAANLLIIDSGGSVLACPVTFWHAIIPARWLTDTSCFDRRSLPDRFFVVAGRTDIERDAIHLTLGAEEERFSVGPTYDIYLYRTADTDPSWLDLPIRDGKDAVFPMHLPAKHLQLIHDKAVIDAGDVVATGEQGTVIYGPYVALPKGSYVATWIGSGVDSTGGLDFAVTADGGSRLAQASLDPSKLAHDRRELVRLPFKLSAPRDNVEVIIGSRGGARISLHELVIQRLR